MRLIVLLLAAVAAMLLPSIAEARFAATATESAKKKRCRAVAEMKGDRVIPPRCAPWQIRRAIRAANRIRKAPYVWGGGHSLAPASGFDCSGAVSYVLRRAKLLRHPRVSGALAVWRRPGRGRWLSVYAHSGHAYMVIAGRRFDTSGGVPGPRWREEHRARLFVGGYAVRHARGL